MLGITVLPTLTAYKSTRVQPGHKVTIEQRQDVVAYLASRLTPSSYRPDDRKATIWLKVPEIVVW